MSFSSWTYRVAFGRLQTLQSITWVHSYSLAEDTDITEHLQEMATNWELIAIFFLVNITWKTDFSSLCPLPWRGDEDDSKCSDLHFFFSSVSRYFRGSVA